MMTTTKSRLESSLDPIEDEAPVRSLTILGKPTWIVFLAVIAVVIAFYSSTRAAPLRQFLYPSLTFLSLAVFAFGVRRHRPARPLAFWLFGLGTLSTGVGDVVYMFYGNLFGVEIPYPSLADVLYIGAYAFWAGGLLVLVRERRGRGDVGGWIDTAIAITAFALLEFVLLIYPYFTAPDMPLPGRIVSSAYPVGDLLMLAVLVRLLVSPGSRTMSFRLLVAGFLACFASDAVYGFVALNGTYSGGVIDLGWMSGYSFFAAAALHPSVRTLAMRVPDDPPRLSRRRLAVLAGLALVAPALFAYTAGTAVSAPLGAAISLGAVILFLLVTFRMSGLVRVLDGTMNQLVVAHEARDRLLHQTLRTSEDDRVRLAGELHDGPVQQLTALSFRVGSLAARLAATGERAVDLRPVQEALAAQIADVRRMMTTLRPGSLEERGLEGALADYVSALPPNGDQQKIVRVCLASRPGTGVETILYRVAQEAIKNVVRHAHASTMRVSVAEDDDHIYLEVADDGVGFDAERSFEEQHFGLMTMRERIEMTGGTLKVTSVPDKGTSVSATVPKGVMV